MTPEQRAIRDANPDERSPRLRINRENTAVARELTKLRVGMILKNKSSGAFRAPEVTYEQADVHGPTIISALLEQGEVKLWKLSRQAPGYPQSGGGGFQAAVNMILVVGGVEVIWP